MTYNEMLKEKIDYLEVILRKISIQFEGDVKNELDGYFKVIDKINERLL